MLFSGPLRRVSAALGHARDRESNPIAPILEEPSSIQRCVRALFSSPWVEVIGVCLGMVTVWYLRKNDDHGGPNGNGAGGGRRPIALSERVARGIPLLVAMGLWQGLITYGGQESCLDPLICMLSWILLEMMMTYIPLAAWDAIDIGPPNVEHAIVRRDEARLSTCSNLWSDVSRSPVAPLGPLPHAEERTRSRGRDIHLGNVIGTEHEMEERAPTEERPVEVGSGVSGEGARRRRDVKKRDPGGGGVWRSQRSASSNRTNSTNGTINRNNGTRRRTTTGHSSEIGTRAGLHLGKAARQDATFSPYRYIEAVASPGPGAFGPNNGSRMFGTDTEERVSGGEDEKEERSTRNHNGDPATRPHTRRRSSLGAGDLGLQRSSAFPSTNHAIYPGSGAGNFPASVTAGAVTNAADSTPSAPSRPAAKRPRSFIGSGPTLKPTVDASPVKKDDSNDDHIPPPPPPAPLSMERAVSAKGSIVGGASGTPGSSLKRTPVRPTSRTPGSGISGGTPHSRLSLTPGSGISTDRTPITEVVPSRTRNGSITAGGGAGASSRRGSSRRWPRRARAASASSIAYSNRQRFDSLRSAKGDASSWAAAVTGVITKRSLSTMASSGAGGSATDGSGARAGTATGAGGKRPSFSSPAAKKGRPTQIYNVGFAGTDIEEESGGRGSRSTSASGSGAVGHEDDGGASPAAPDAVDEPAMVEETWRGWGVGDPLFGAVKGGAEEVVEGTPVPLEFRPFGREHDVLCTWQLDHLRKDEDVGMFAQGTFGKVVAARTETGRQLAVKIMEKSELSPERYIDRELELLQECSVHPHVVSLLGVIKTMDKVYVLMPLADSDVAAMIKSSTRLNEKQASYVIRQVVSAVEFLHERNIVHRDIKPANLLVLSNKLLLADFGLAKRIPQGQDAISGACGTKPYLAPELVRDLPYDETVDLWAIGVVTYELLHGHTPFRSPLKHARSWDGLMPEVRKTPGTNNAAGTRDSHVDDTSHSYGFSGSVSESSGSIVGGRMFERSAPAAPNAGLDRAWLAGQAAQHALMYGGKGDNGHDDDDGALGVGWLGGGAAGRRGGYRVADQMRLLDNIARGRYAFREGLVGESGRSFISQLLQQSPARRMSAARATEHTWISGGSPAKVAPRRRAARAEVASVTAQRAAESAERYAMRARSVQEHVQEQLVDVENQMAAQAASGAVSGNVRRVQKIVDGVSADAESTTATVTTLTEIANLAAMMALEANLARNDAKRLEKNVTAATNSASAAAAHGSAADVVGQFKAAEAAAQKAEAAVSRGEALAREADAGGNAAARAFVTWEESRTATAAAEEAQAPAGAATVERSKNYANREMIWSARQEGRDLSAALMAAERRAHFGTKASDGILRD